MKPPFALRFASLLLSALTLNGAQAADVVIDPSNLAQNTLTAIRTLTMIQNQVQQLDNELQMLGNQAKHLEQLDYDSLQAIRAGLAETRRLLKEAADLPYDIAQLDAQFARLYPSQYSTNTTQQTLEQDSRQRWEQERAGVQTALRLQGQVEANLAEDEAQLAALETQSQGAIGALQAVQATNQLLALQAKQRIQEQQLQLTQGRAMALQLARQNAAQEKARKMREQFMGNGTPYTPSPVRFYVD